MKITHLSTFDIQGGAARAAYRLHQGLIEIGQQSQILSLYKASQDINVLEVSGIELEKNLDFVYSNSIQNNYINNQRSSLSNTLFSLSYPGLNLHQLDLIKNSDIINLHWVADGFQSPVTINKLLNLGKPVVWTLHDMWAFTGGCHYSAGCNKYQEECLNCPQLSNDIYELPHANLKDKIDLFNHPNLVIVTPSKWLAECAKKSQVFRNNQIEVIPNSLDIEVFKPLPKSEAKQFFNISPDNIILLIGAADGKEKRKGFSELVTVLNICQKNPNFAQLINDNKITIGCFGKPNEELNQLNLNTIYFGNIDSDEKLSKIYSAADIFILPSLEDNFPNTMLESMSCGTPVIAFNIGGIPDLIENKVTGMLIPPQDLNTMAEKIIECVLDLDLTKIMGKKSREVMEKNYYLSLQAQNYLTLYQNLIKQSKPVINTLNKAEQNNLNNSYFCSVNSYFSSHFQQIYSKVALNAITINQDKLEQKLKNTQEQLQRMEVELKQAYDDINAMKSSKFWQLRNKWFKLKKLLNLPNSLA